MNNKNKFKGIFVALNAIFNDDESINLDATKLLVKKYKALGVKGVYACGSTGEGFLLSNEERKQIAKAVKEAAGDDFTVIVHIGCFSTKDSIELAKHAESIGVDAVSAVPCIYYHLPEESIELHWNSIIDATELPFIIYNIPQLTGYNLSFDLLKKMADNKKVIGIKNSAEPVYLMERYRKIAGDDFVIFNGSDEQLLGGRLMGADSGIGGTYGCMPELFVALDKMIDSGNIEEAKILQNKINEIIFALLDCKSLYGASKAVITRRYGIDCKNPRKPFLPVDKNDKKIISIANKIDEYVKELQ